ncbi:MAG: hypothetical protein ACI81R_001520 [Bradymonadia bacterium]|jgi:hypothetical protein
MHGMTRPAQFPTPDPDGSYSRALREFDFEPLALHVQSVLGLDGALVRFSAGSVPVFAVGDDVVLKMFPPDDDDGAETEWNALRAWRTRQVNTLVEEQRGLGLSDAWATRLGPFISRVLSGFEPRGAALLHTELMPAHLTVAPRDGRPTVVGICDFEPAMFGDVDYEFASIGAFMSMGDAAVLTPVLGGWMIAPAERTHALSERLLAMLLLHRYCHLPQYLERMPKAEQRTLPSLAQSWFGQQ